jgi:hypothetical protein
VAYADTNSSSPGENAFRERVLLRGSDCPATSYYSYYLHAWLVDNMARPTALSAAANISAPRMLATADAATSTGCSVRSTVHVLAQCARDRPAAECVSCLQDSARSVDWDVDADRLDGGVAAAVVGFNCYLSFNVSTSVQTDCELSLSLSPSPSPSPSLSLPLSLSLSLSLSPSLPLSLSQPNCKNSMRHHHLIYFSMDNGITTGYHELIYTILFAFQCFLLSSLEAYYLGH